MVLECEPEPRDSESARMFAGADIWVEGFWGALIISDGFETEWEAATLPLVRGKESVHEHGTCAN